MSKKINKKDILQNIFWIFFDKAFILILKFFVGVKIANYYGAGEFGNYQYLASIVGFSPLLYDIVNERIVQKFFSIEDYKKVIGSVTVIRLLMSFAILLVAYFYCFYVNASSETTWIFIFLVVNNLFTHLYFGIQSYYEYQLKARKVVVPVNISKSIVYGVINYLIIQEVEIVYIPMLHAMGSLIALLIIIYLFGRDFSLRLGLDRKVLFRIVMESKFLWISTTAFVIFSQMDKVMLGSIIDEESVGVYSIAMVLMTITSILLTPIRNTAFPILIKHKDDFKKFEQVYLKFCRQTTLIYLLVLPASVIVLKYTFHLFFIEEYNDCLIVYNILMSFIFIQAVCNLQTSYLTIYNKTVFLLYKNVIGMLINLVLNFILIREIGIYGAAVATAITQFATYYVLNFFFKETIILNKWVLESFAFWKLLRKEVETKP